MRKLALLLLCLLFTASTVFADGIKPIYGYSPLSSTAPTSGDPDQEYLDAIEDIRTSNQTMGIIDAWVTPLSEIYQDILDIEAYPPEKEAIRQAVINKNVFISESINLASYPEYIAQIATVTSPDFNHVKIIPNVELAEDITSGTAVILKGEVIHSGVGTATNYPDTPPPGPSRGVGITADSQRLVVSSYGGTPSLRVYTWNATTVKYEVATAPDVLPGSNAWGVCMSADGDYLAVTSYGISPYLSTYKWNPTSNQYEKTASPNTLPGSKARDVAMSSDGRILAIASEDTSPKLVTYLWSTEHNQYVSMAPPDFIDSRPISVTLSATGEYMVVANYNASPYLRSYKLNVLDNQYKATTSPDNTPIALPIKVCLSADGQALAVAGVTSSPYLATYHWNKTNDRYELDATPDTPLPNTIGVSFTANGEFLATCSDVTAPYLKTYKWNATNGKYEALAAPTTLPSADSFSLVYSIDGTTLAVVGETSPILTTYKINTVSYETYKIYPVDIPSYYLPTDAWAFGFVTESASAAATLDVTALWWRDYLD